MRESKSTGFPGTTEWVLGGIILATMAISYGKAEVNREAITPTPTPYTAPTADPSREAYLVSMRMDNEFDRMRVTPQPTATETPRPIPSPQPTPYATALRAACADITYTRGLGYGRRCTPIPK